MVYPKTKITSKTLNIRFIQFIVQDYVRLLSEKIVPPKFSGLSFNIMFLIKRYSKKNHFKRLPHFQANTYYSKYARPIRSTDQWLYHALTIKCWMKSMRHQVVLQDVVQCRFEFGLLGYQILGMDMPRFCCTRMNKSFITHNPYITGTYIHTYIYIYIHNVSYMTHKSPIFHPYITHIDLSIYPAILSIYPSIDLSIYWSIDLPIYQTIHPSIYLSIYLFIYLSIYL